MEIIQSVECLMGESWTCGAGLHSLGANSFIILRLVVKLVLYINSAYYRPLLLDLLTPYFAPAQPLSFGTRLLTSGSEQEPVKILAGVTAT